MKQTFYATRLNKYSLIVFCVHSQISFSIGLFNPRSLAELKMLKMFAGTICKFVVYSGGGISMSIIK